MRSKMDNLHGKYKKVNVTFLSLVSTMIALGLVSFSLSWAEIYKYVDGEGVLHVTNVPNGKYNFVLKGGGCRFPWFPPTLKNMTH
jgi:hypothetical protein